jgi:hypothetical protein
VERAHLHPAHPVAPSERNRQRWKPAPAWQGAVCLAWSGLAGWLAFARDERVPLLAFVNLGFHELGHLVCYLVPATGTVVTAAAGSTMQCAVPLGIAGYFLVLRRDRLAAAACLAWAATNFQEAAVYIADAPYERLQLIGGDHDWATVLGPAHLNRLQDAADIAGAVRALGVVLLVLGVALCAWTLVASRAPAPDVTEAAGPDASERFLV